MIFTNYVLFSFLPAYVHTGGSTHSSFHVLMKDVCAREPHSSYKIFFHSLIRCYVCGACTSNLTFFFTGCLRLYDILRSYPKTIVGTIVRSIFVDRHFLCFHPDGWHHTWVRRRCACISNYHFSLSFFFVLSLKAYEAIFFYVNKKEYVLQVARVCFVRIFSLSFARVHVINCPIFQMCVQRIHASFKFCFFFFFFFFAFIALIIARMVQCWRVIVQRQRQHIQIKWSHIVRPVLQLRCFAVSQYPQQHCPFVIFVHSTEEISGGVEPSTSFCFVSRDKTPKSSDAKNESAHFYFFKKM